MKRDVISTESAEDLKQSVMELIDYTPAMLADEVKNALHVSETDEGVRGSIWVFSGIEFGRPVAWCTIDVSATALEEWQKRIAHCVSLLSNKQWFHVEQSQKEIWARAATTFKIKVKHDRP